MNPPRPLTYFLGIFAALTLTVALVMTVMRPPLNDLMQLAVLFAITGSASGLVGYVAFQLGWWRRLPRLDQTLTLGYVLAAGLTLLNVWLTARLMFINEHDLTLAGLLLLFASGISISFGYFLSASLTHIICEVALGAEAVSRGDFSKRVNVIGTDEVAQLAQSFNIMATRLQQADADARALDAARRDLVAWASHDLHTPLASLRAMLEALTEGVVTDAETTARYLRQSQAEVARLSALTDDLFQLAQLDARDLVLRCEPSSLADLISDTLEGFTARAVARQVTLTGEVAPGIDPVWMAPDKISRVLRNLVDNALRHTPPQGKVLLNAKLDGAQVIVSVQDTGAGITSEELPRIFDRFYRGDVARAREPTRAGGGAGLGLAIAKGLVEAHQGRIWAESAVGRGTTIAFALPKAGA